MSAGIKTVFTGSIKGCDLPKDKTYLGLSSSMIGKISLLITGLTSWIYFGATLYSLTQRKISLRNDAKLLLISGTVGYLTITFAKKIRHYDQRGSIISYNKEIYNKLKTIEGEKSLLKFIMAKHGWNNIKDYRILEDSERTEVLRQTLKHENFFTAVKKYPDLEICVVNELWTAWSSKKTILELFEDCDFPMLENVCPNDYTTLYKKKLEWEREIHPMQRAYDAYRKQTRRDPSQECSVRERKLITAFDYAALLRTLQRLEKDFSCRRIEFF